MGTKLKVVHVFFFLPQNRNAFLKYKIHFLYKNSTYTEVHKKQK